MKVVLDITVFGWTLMVLRNWETSPFSLTSAFPQGKVLIFRRTEIILCKRTSPA
jgi:hypothetical protein